MSNWIEEYQYDRQKRYAALFAKITINNINHHKYR